MTQWVFSKMVQLSTLCVYVISFIKIALSAESSQCDVCKNLVKDFQQGLDKTVKSNFGGGNTKWEETSLGKWKTSETRLVEIVDNHICKGNEKLCHMFFENNEESIEDWYFNVYKNEESSDGLHDHLCVTSAQVCCPHDRFGEKCDPCPQTSTGEICGGNGVCKGAGTKSNDGTCLCNTGYDGDLCDECAEEYYEKKENDKLKCYACDMSCEDTCTGPGPKACDTCKNGYTWDELSGCTDLNECDDVEVCDEVPGTYCFNTLGSYRCQNCHESCEQCSGGSSSQCTKCKEGYEVTNPSTDTASSCKDVDECVTKDEACSHVIGSRCVNAIGSYRCVCPENYHNEENKCIKDEITDEDSRQSNEKEEKGTNDVQTRQTRKNISTKAAKATKAARSIKQTSDKYDEGKRRYRTLDTMVFVSATSLYLVIVLVFRAESVKTSTVTVLYSMFIYQFSGQFL